MTQLLTLTPWSAASSLRPVTGVPALPRWFVSRPRIDECLDEATRCALTLVTGPVGAGKTVAVASWIRRGQPSYGVTWLDWGSLDDDPAQLWQRLCEVPSIPTRSVDLLMHRPASTGQDERVPTSLVTSLAELGPWLIVLDNVESKASPRLERALAALISSLSSTAVRVVVVARVEPSIGQHRLHIAGQLARVDGRELAMDAAEIAGTLARLGVSEPDARAAPLLQITSGWAAGVHLAARILRGATSDAAALNETRDAVRAYLRREVLAALTETERELLARTSVCEVVPVGLARALAGTAEVAEVHDRHGFVHTDADGAVWCHPLLRAAARHQLDLESPTLARQLTRRAAHWYAAGGRYREAIETGVAGEDWRWVARTLTESLAVPALLLGEPEVWVTAAVSTPGVAKESPLLVAAAAAGAGRTDAAEQALDRWAAGLDGRAVTSAELISEVLTRLVVARARGDSAEVRRRLNGLGTALTERSLTTPAVWDDLVPLVAPQEAAWLLGEGRLREAAAVLVDARRCRATSPASSLAQARCTGLLALVEALRGHADTAHHLAAEVWTMPGDDRRVVATQCAELAVAWAHLMRGELRQARQRLGHLHRISDVADPVLLSLHRLAEGRLCIAEGSPEDGIEALATADPTPRTGVWVRDELTVLHAEALLAAGERKAGMALLTPPPAGAAVSTALLVARVRLGLGDLRGARAGLGPALEPAADALVPQQIQAWLLEAELAESDGLTDRAQRLVDRCLRIAATERLVLPLLPSRAWLARFVSHDRSLARRHQETLSRLMSDGEVTVPAPRGRRASGAASAPAEELSARELQVLELLTHLYTTSEIGAELYVTSNTVKTHLRNLYRKLGVTRRSDAVRRGRELGLC